MKAIAVAGLGFGDEGKGTTVDALAEKFGAGLVVRYNGGAQAAHNVIRKGTHHTFSQFGSATLLGARTHLSMFVIVNPGALLNEAAALEAKGIAGAHQLVSVSPEALITTPYHIFANRHREGLRGKGAHGTTGMGVGETVELARRGVSMRVADLFNNMRFRRKLDDVREAYLEEFPGQPSLTNRDTFEHTIGRFREFSERIVIRNDEELEVMMRRAKTTIFEGAQGMLLDQFHGFHPYSTWSDCTFDQALTLIEEIDDVQLTRLGVLRSYHTRHGAGPLPTEKESFAEVTREDHNAKTPGAAGKFRAGPFDLVLARYGTRSIGQIGGLVMTHLDKLPAGGTAPYAYKYFDHGTESAVANLHEYQPEKIAKLIEYVEPRCMEVSSKEFPDHISEMLGLPLYMTSSGPTSADKKFLRGFGS